MVANVIFSYSAAEAESDGTLMRFAPKTAAEYGFQIPVLVTSAAYAETIEWTRPGDEWMQSEDARFWDVLTMARVGISRSTDPSRAEFHVARVPNRTRSGAFSGSERATTVAMKITAEGYTGNGDACLIISLLEED